MQRPGGRNMGLFNREQGRMDGGKAVKGAEEVQLKGVSFI